MFGLFALPPTTNYNRPTAALTTHRQDSMPDCLPGSPFPSPWKNPGFKKFVFVASPNYNRRPDGPNTVVDTVVLHATVTPTLEKTAEWFYTTKSEVSAHFVIGRDGSIVQCVSTYDRAWHAGASRDFLGRGNLNNFSIGIEIVNFNDGKDPYPAAQVEAVKALIQALKRRFPLKYITSHEYIALPYGRKTDPKAFPWQKLKDLNLKMVYEGHAPVKPGDPK